MKAILAMTFLVFWSDCNGSSYPSDVYKITDSTAVSLSSEFDEKRFVASLGVPAEIKWKDQFSEYKFILGFSVSRNKTNLKENGMFSVKLLEVKFRNGKRVSCNVSYFYAVGNFQELTPLEVTKVGIREDLQSCRDAFAT